MRCIVAFARIIEQLHDHMRTLQSNTIARHIPQVAPVGAPSPDTKKKALATHCMNVQNRQTPDGTDPAKRRGHNRRTHALEKKRQAAKQEKAVPSFCKVGGSEPAGSGNERRHALLDGLTQDPKVAACFNGLPGQVQDQLLKHALDRLEEEPLSEVKKNGTGIAALIGKNPSVESIAAAVYGWWDPRAVLPEQKQAMLAELLGPGVPMVVLDNILEESKDLITPYKLHFYAQELKEAIGAERSLKRIEAWANDDAGPAASPHAWRTDISFSDAVKRVVASGIGSITGSAPAGKLAGSFAGAVAGIPWNLLLGIYKAHRYFAGPAQWIEGSPQDRKQLRDLLMREPALASRLSYLSAQELEEGLDFILGPLKDSPVAGIDRVGAGIAALVGKNPSFERIRAAVYGWWDPQAVVPEQKEAMLAELLGPKVHAPWLKKILEMREGQPLSNLYDEAATINAAIGADKSPPHVKAVIEAWARQDIGPTVLNLQRAAAWAHFLNFAAQSGQLDLFARGMSAYLRQGEYTAAGHRPGPWVVADAKARDAQGKAAGAEVLARAAHHVADTLSDLDRELHATSPSEKGTLLVARVQMHMNSLQASLTNVRNTAPGAQLAAEIEMMSEVARLFPRQWSGSNTPRGIDFGFEVAKADARAREYQDAATATRREASLLTGQAEVLRLRTPFHEDVMPAPAGLRGQRMQEKEANILATKAANRASAAAYAAQTEEIGPVNSPVPGAPVPAPRQWWPLEKKPVTAVSNTQLQGAPNDVSWWETFSRLGARLDRAISLLPQAEAGAISREQYTSVSIGAEVTEESEQKLLESLQPEQHESANSQSPVTHVVSPAAASPSPEADPELQAFLDDQAPALLSKDAWVLQELLNYARSEFQTSMANLDPEQQRTYIASYRTASTAGLALTSEIKAIKDEFELKGMATLAASIEAATGKKVNPKTTYIHTRYVEPSSRHKRALAENAPREHLQTMSLWDAACMNFGFDTGIPTHASGYSYSQASFINADPHGSTHHRSSSSAFDQSSMFPVATFLRIVRDINLGKALEDTIQSLLADDGPLRELLHQAAHAQWDFDVLEAYRDAKASGVTQKPFEALQRALQDGGRDITIQPFTLHFGVSLPHEAMDNSAAVPLFLIKLKGDLSVFSYFPGRPGGALRYHTSPHAALTAFQDQLTDGNSDLTWFTRQLPLAKLSKFSAIAKDNSHLGPAEKASDPFWKNPGNHLRIFLQEAFRSTTSRLSKVRLKPEALPDRPQAQTGSPADALCDRQAARYRADLRMLATPKHEKDWQVIKDTAISVGQEILEMLMTPVPGGVTGLGKVIQAAAFGSLVYGSASGAVAAANGNPAEFAGALGDVADLLISQRLNGVAGKLSQRRTQQLMAQLGGPRKVTLADGKQALWRPDIRPYATVAPARLAGLTANAQGLFEQNGKQYIQVHDGNKPLVAEVTYDAQRKRYFLAHPDPTVFKPPVAYDPDTKVWALALDDSSTLTDAALLAKMLPAASSMSAQQVERLLRSTGTSRATLDGIWAGRTVPASLADGLARAQADQYIQQMITRLPERDYMPADGDSIVLCLLTQLPGWPVDTSLDVYNLGGKRIASYAADGRGNLPFSVALQRRSNGEYVTKGDLTSGASNQEQMFRLILGQLPATSDLGKGGNFEGATDNAGRTVVIREQIANLANSERALLFDVLKRTQYPGRIKSGNDPTDKFLPLLPQAPSGLPPMLKKLQEASPTLSAATLVELVQRHPLSRSEKSALLARGAIPPVLHDAMRQAQHNLRLDLALDGVYSTRTFNPDSDVLAREAAEALLQVRLNRPFIVMETTDGPYVQSGPDDPTVVLRHAGAGYYEAYDLRNGGSIPVRPGTDSFYQAIGSVLQPHERSVLGMNGETDVAGLRATLGELAADNRGIFQSLFDSKFGKQHRIAKVRLNTIVANAGKDSNTLGAAEKEAFSYEVDKLVKTSKADGKQAIKEYGKDSAAEINDPLRSGTTTPKVQAFLTALGAMSNYEGFAYRSAHVTPGGAAMLENGVGKVFVDHGVQSASTQQINAKDWETRAADNAPEQAQQRVLFIFDETVTKKNIATDILRDHVAIEPGTSLQVLATERKEATLYVYFTTPSKVSAKTTGPELGLVPCRPRRDLGGAACALQLETELKPLPRGPGQRAQALEHRRFQPSSGASTERLFVWNRTVYKYDELGREFTVAPPGEHPGMVDASSRLTYSDAVIGRRLHEDAFGLSGRSPDAELASATWVVELDGIVGGIDDKRALRAFVIDQKLVVEADAEVFYASPIPQSGDALQFGRLPPFPHPDADLSKRMLKEKSRLSGGTTSTLGRIILPPASAFSELENFRNIVKNPEAKPVLDSIEEFLIYKPEVVYKNPVIALSNRQKKIRIAWERQVPEFVPKHQGEVAPRNWDAYQAPGGKPEDFYPKDFMTDLNRNRYKIRIQDGPPIELVDPDHKGTASTDVIRKDKLKILES